MKLVRTRDDSGSVVWADEIAPGTGLILEGDVFGSFRVTDRGIAIRERLAPIQPPAIIGIAQNYRKHALEMGSTPPERPVFFVKLPSAIQDPSKPIFLPLCAGSTKVDYEAELAVVIGRTCRNVSEDVALDFVLGYTCANDVSARDWQKEWGGGQFCRGKSFDGFCPVGPRIVTTDEIPDPSQLFLRGFLNESVVQESPVSDMVFSVPQLIAFLSQSTTLLPGTLILTGTPSGVGAGRIPQRFLQEGDIFTVDIPGIGRLVNPVCGEPPAPA